MSQHSLEDANAHTQSVPALQRQAGRTDQAMVMAMVLVGCIAAACSVGLLVLMLLA